MSDANAQAPSLLDERLEIETPERVLLVYDIAGIGSRFAAGTIDVAILLFVFTTLFVLVAIVGSVTLPTNGEARMAFALAAFGGFGVVLAAYYIGFEVIWNGQTPGKRWLKLRVISEDGSPAGTGSLVLRNILRVIDLAPFVAPYGLGGIVMFVNSRAKRIGDFASGTIVVRERPETLVVPRAARADETLPGEALGAADLAMAQAFAARAGQMIGSARAGLAQRIADDIAKRHALTYTDAEKFLKELARGRTPKELRELGGPKL